MEGGAHGTFEVVPEWLEKPEHKEALEAKLASERLLGAVRIPQLCPLSFGDLPPIGQVRVLAPSKTVTDQDHVMWTWTLVSRQPWGGLALSLKDVILYAPVPHGEVEFGMDHVWILTLEVDRQHQERGDVLRFRQFFSPANGRIKLSASQSELIPSEHSIETLVGISDAELTLGIGDSVILATVDGNSMRLVISEEVKLELPRLRSPWDEKIKERIIDPAQDMIHYEEDE